VLGRARQADGRVTVFVQDADVTRATERGRVNGLSPIAATRASRAETKEAA